MTKQLTVCLYLFLIGLPQLFAQKTTEWSSTGGPWGADATSFHEDKKGIYWLGTGSSGGVFKSHDKGQIWMPVNRGIGPRHISWIGEFEGHLYIEVAREASIVDFQDEEPFDFYQWQELTYSWQMADEGMREKLLLHVHKEAVQRYQQLSKNYPVVLDEEIQTDKEGLINSYSERPWMEPLMSRHIKGLAPQVPKSEAINRSFPKDVYALRGWNFYQTHEGHLLVLAKSGVYQLQDTAFVQMGQIGLQATDITQLAWANNRTYYAIVNYHSLARFEGDRWKTLYDGAKDGALAPSNQTARINVHKNGRVLVCIKGAICEIMLDGSVHTLVEPFRIPEPGSIDGLLDKLDFKGRFAAIDTLHINFNSAAFDTLGRLWAYGMAEWHGVLVRMDQLDKKKYGSAHALPESLSYQAGYGNPDFIASNPYNGDIWHCSGSEARLLGERGYTIPFNLEYFDGHSGNLVAFGPDGSMALAFNPKGDVNRDMSKAKLYLERPNGIGKLFDAPLLGLVSLGFDEVGTLYAGTGYQVHNPNDVCSWGLAGKAQGLYRFNGASWDSIANPINPWVMSLAPSLGNRLMVGTSGSGLYEVTIPRSAQPAQNTSYNLLIKEGKQGLEIDGKTIIEPLYQGVYPVNAETFAFLIESHDNFKEYGLANKAGHKSEMRLLSFRNIDGGYWLCERLVKDTVHEQLVLDANLKMVNALQGQDIRAIPGGFIVKKDGQFGLYDMQAKEIFPPTYKDLHYMSGGYLFSKDGGSTLFDSDLQEQATLPYASSPIGKLLRVSERGKYGLITFPEGKEVIQIVFDSIRPFISGEGYALAYHEGKVGIYNLSASKWSLASAFEHISVAKYEQADPYDEEVKEVLMLHCQQEGLFGIYDLLNEAWVLNRDYTRLELISGDYLIAQKDGLEGLYQLSTNTWLLPLGKQHLSALKYPTGLPEEWGEWGMTYKTDIKVAVGKKVGLYSLELQSYLLPLEFSAIEVGDMPGIKAKGSKGWGLYSTEDGSKLVEPIWMDIAYDPASYTFTMKSKKGEAATFSHSSEGAEEPAEDGGEEGAPVEEGDGGEDDGGGE